MKLRLPTLGEIFAGALEIIASIGVIIALWMAFTGNIPSHPDVPDEPEQPDLPQN